MAGRLAPVDELPKIDGLDVPRDFYWILRQPAPLAGMAYPGRKVLPSGETLWKTLHDAGFRHVVCFTGSPPGYDPSPLRHLYAEELEDLCHGGEPQDPAWEERLVRRAVDLTTKRLSSGEGVVVHCGGGTGRTRTVLACALKELGLTTSEIVSYLRQLSRARGKHPGWPESPWQGRVVERFLAQND